MCSACWLVAVSLMFHEEQVTSLSHHEGHLFTSELVVYSRASCVLRTSPRDERHDRIASRFLWSSACWCVASLLLSSLELSDTKVYESKIRALPGTASHFCEVETTSHFCEVESIVESIPRGPRRAPGPDRLPLPLEQRLLVGCGEDVFKIFFVG